MNVKKLFSILLSAAITVVAIFICHGYGCMFTAAPQFAGGVDSMVERLPVVPPDFKAVHEVALPANQLVVNVSSREEVFKAAEGGVGYVALEHFRENQNICTRLCYLAESGGKWTVHRTEWATDDFPGCPPLASAGDPYIANGFVVRNLSVNYPGWIAGTWVAPSILALVFFVIIAVCFNAILSGLARLGCKVRSQAA